MPAIVLILCLLSLSCFGQAFTLRDVAFVGRISTPAFVLTNEPAGSGANLISWWLFSDYVTNAGIATLPDRGGVHSWDFTNGTTSAFPIGSSSNLLFSSTASSKLTSGAYVGNQPHTIVLVLMDIQATNVAASTAFYDGINSGHRNLYRHINTSEEMYSGTAVAFQTYSVSNIVRCVELTFAGAVSKAYTNGVLAATLNAGVQNQDQGMQLAFGSGGSGASYRFFEMATYSATNTPTQRSNIYYYFKTTKGYPLP